MSSQYDELRPSSGWDRFGAPQQISTGFASCFRYCADLAQRTSTKLYTMFGRVLGWCTIYTSSEAVAPKRNFARCMIHFASKVLRSPILIALLDGTRKVGVSQTLRSAEGATYIGRAAITLGIGPHSRYTWIGKRMWPWLVISAVLSKLKDFWRLQAVTYTIKVAVSRKRCYLVRTT